MIGPSWAPSRRASRLATMSSSDPYSKSPPSDEPTTSAFSDRVALSADRSSEALPVSGSVALCAKWPPLMAAGRCRLPLQVQRLAQQLMFALVLPPLGYCQRPLPVPCRRRQVHCLLVGTEVIGTTSDDMVEMLASAPSSKRADELAGASARCPSLGEAPALAPESTAAS